MNREKYPTRTIRIVSWLQVQTIQSLAPTLPIDPENPIVVTFGEEVLPRKKSQNDLMWSGPLKDISEQAYYHGRRYSDKLWHETYKRLFLPEEFDAELCKEGYRKWDFDRDGEKVLVGSTTELTVKGFALYLEQVYADGANMGVMFHEKPAEPRKVRAKPELRAVA